MKPIKIPELSPREILFECLALLGVLAMTGVLALAMRIGEGNW